MLRQDFGIDVVRNLPVLELEPTPSLCQKAAEYIARRAANAAPKGADPSFRQIEDELELLMPGLRWLVARRCAADDALAAVQASVLAYPDSSYAGDPALAARRRVDLDDLAALRRVAGH